MSKKKKKTLTLIKKGVKGIFLTCFFFGVFLIIYSTTVIANAPKIDTSDIYSYLSESSVIYDDQGKAIDNIFVDGGNRINVEYDELPKNLVNAVVSIEDKTFWEHNGFNFVRILGAVRDSIFSVDSIGGTSTITQQLARNVYLSESKSERSLNRKITEAWYTVILERNLTKKQIVEAYLNTIYLGNNAYGVQAASQSYFSKDIKDLTLLECASLASLPQSPDRYALVKNINPSSEEGATVELKKEDILSQDSNYITIYNGDASKDRRDTTLSFMEEQKYISGKEKDAALSADLRSSIKVNNDSFGGFSAYFSDFLISEVTKAFVEEGYTEEAAKKLIYTGGLKIYTTLNTQAQKSIEDAFADNSNFPNVNFSSIKYDTNRNILNKYGSIALYSYSNYLDGNGNFNLSSNDFTMDETGNMILYKDKRLNFYETQVNSSTDYSVEFKSMYLQQEGVLYSIESGTLLIPQKYKSKDAEGNLVIASEFFDDAANIFTKTNSGYSVGEKGYSLKQKVRQPQAAMVIIDNKTGGVKAMVGGRDTSGQMLYNRAINPRQPGSSIKPLSIYSSALQQGANAAASGTPLKYTEFDKNQKTEGYGNYWTAASLINDAPLTINGQVWPKNAYSGHMGQQTMRVSVEQSINVNAVRIYQQLGNDYSISQLEKFGISTVVKEGATNDLNPSALALGGMAKGITPLDLASAYMTFPNQGTHIDYTCFTEIKNRNDETFLQSTPKKTKVLDAGVAFIMSDILRTTVTEGIGSPAATPQVTAGKTGTTDNQMDIWFAGFTPQYSAALWMGNDVNIELTEGSNATARLWGKIMTNATAGMTGSLPGQPSNVIKKDGEYFVNGTQAGLGKKEEEKKEVEVETCVDSGYIASPWCTNRKNVVMEEKDNHSKYYCPVHNQDPEKYPVAPGEKVDVIKEEEEETEETPDPSIKPST